jgi:hypothetical protein
MSKKISQQEKDLEKICQDAIPALETLEPVSDSDEPISMVEVWQRGRYHLSTHPRNQMALGSAGIY